MHAVIKQMGWFANLSHKKKILQALQEKTQVHEINTEQLKFLLINFINVCLINRFYSITETHTAKACLSYLNDPEYQSLAGFFEIGYPIQNKDLLDFVSKNRYKFYQKESSREYQIDENNLRLATQQVMF